MGTGPIYRWDEYPSKMQQAGGQRTGLWEEALIFRRGKGVDDEEEAEELPTVDAGEKAQQASQEQNSWSDGHVDEWVALAKILACLSTKIPTSEKAEASWVFI